MDANATAIKTSVNVINADARKKKEHFSLAFALPSQIQSMNGGYADVNPIPSSPASLASLDVNVLASTSTSSLAFAPPV